MSTKPIIYLTGFGPFGPHEINASEQAVKLVSHSFFCKCIILLLYYYLPWFKHFLISKLQYSSLLFCRSAEQRSLCLRIVKIVLFCQVSESQLEEELGVELVTCILDVNYDKTQQLVPQHWEKYKPKVN